MPIRVYLAGPDVFLPFPRRHAAAQAAICARYGLTGVSPLDPLPDEPTEWISRGRATRIALRNETHIRRCDAVIANLTPFRGPSADPGTVYEVGFARALGRPVFAYSTSAMDYAARVRLQHPDDGMEIEDFGLFDNLMLACAIQESGGSMVHGNQGALAVFEKSVAEAARVLTDQEPGSTRRSS